MKKSLMLFAALLMFSGAGFAQYGGYSGASNAKCVNASDVKNLRDGEFVTLIGTIQSKIGNEKYSFKDKTGTVTVEIDDKDWNGLTVSATDNVIIEGEVDKDFRTVEIEVKTVRLSK